MGERVERVAHGPAPTKWYFTPRQIKAVHAQGRTVPKLQPLVTQEEVDELVKEHGSHWKVSDAPISLQLDLIATEILARDRSENVPLAHSERKDYLSPWQFFSRTSREIPFENVEVIAEIVKRPAYRAKFYAERITDRPYDKKGDHPHNLRTQDPRRVK